MIQSCDPALHTISDPPGLLCKCGGLMRKKETRLYCMACGEYGGRCLTWQFNDYFMAQSPLSELEPDERREKQTR